jgi:transposase
MLEFLFPGSNKPRSRAGQGQQGPAPPAGEESQAEPTVPPAGSPPCQDEPDPAPAQPAAADGDSDLPEALQAARLSGRRRGRRLVKPAAPTPPLTPEQRLLLLDTWRRSGLPAKDFAALVGLSPHTLYDWKRKFDQHGPGGLMDLPRGSKRGSKLPELTKRTILMLKEANPSWGCQRISNALLRGPALPASAGAVARVLHEAGYEMEEVATHPQPDHPRRFQRAKPNQLWQTDLFTFVLKRQNRRVYLVAFLDDHSRFVVGYGLHASQSSALVLEVLRAAIASHGTPEEILTDNGNQYVTWRGKHSWRRRTCAAAPLRDRNTSSICTGPTRPSSGSS